MPTFLHAADLHLDSPLRGLERKEGAPAERIRNASREAMGRMIKAAIERKVSFVLLAGDIYDTEPGFETYVFFRKRMEELEEAGIPVAIVLGNHDHAGASPYREHLPGNVHVFEASEPGSHEIIPGVWIHGQSYLVRDIQADLSANYPLARPGALNIGLLHTALDGHSGEHARYAPSSTGRLAHHGYDYWALGHVHARTVLREGRCHIVYPGNLQGRHARETGPKGAMFVEYDRGTILDVGHQAFDDVRWYRIEVDAAGLDQDADLLPQVAARVLAETEESRSAGRLAAVRIRLYGTAPATLVDLGDDEIRDSLRAGLASRDNLFLEKIELDLRLMAQDVREVDRHLTSLVGRLANSPEAEQALTKAWKDLCSGLREVGGPELEAAFKTWRGTEPPSKRVGEELAAALPRVRAALLSSGKGGR